MESIRQLLLQNRAWAEGKTESDPEYFNRLAKIQTPKFLWIGCSDSRVPANEVTGTEPGEIFVHRNIANMVVHTDMNMLSVLQYAVEVLKVEHVIVCGHYGCGGVKAAMSNRHLGLINKWLLHIKDVYSHHQAQLDSISDFDAKADLLVELNVREQVMNLAMTSIIQSAWHHERRPIVHGWVYGLTDGLLKELCTINSAEQIDPVYRMTFNPLPKKEDK